jgi:hypothetical protein
MGEKEGVEGMEREVLRGWRGREEREGGGESRKEERVEGERRIQTASPPL